MNVTNDVGNLLGLKVSKGLHRPELFAHDLQSYVDTHGIKFLCYTNADYQYVEGLAEFRGFHVVRDPRDIVVSSYFSHLYSHPTDGWPELVEHRRKLQSVSKEEGIFLEMKFRSWEFEHLVTWDYEMPNVLEIKMEELSNRPAEQFLQIFRFLGLIVDGHGQNESSQLRDTVAMILNAIHFRSRGLMPVCVERDALSAEQLLQIVDRNSFSNLAGGRRKGEEDVKSHYRKGVAGDWRNHFTEELVQAFKDNYNDLLLRVGYESKPDWIL